MDNSPVRPFASLLLGLAVLSFVRPLPAEVVVNEVFYHAPNDFDDLEWVELHNTRSEPAEISGWRISGGIDFRFPDKSSIPGGGFVVVCKSAGLFGEFYDVPTVGEFKGSIGNGGDTIELRDAKGGMADRVTFKDSQPWPSAADGVGASLERITPGAPGDSPDNWMSSPLPDDEVRPAGSPGRANAVYSENPPPVVRNLVLTPARPGAGMPMQVTVEAEDPDGITAVELRYRLAGPGTVGDERTLPMTSSGGKAYAATIPGQPEASLVRVRVRAIDGKKSERFLPSPNEVLSSVSVYVPETVEGTALPVARVIHTDPKEYAQMERVRKQSLRRRDGPPFANREAGELQEMMSVGLDVREAWFEWSVNRPLGMEALRGFRSLVVRKSAERNQLMEEAMAAENVAAFRSTATARVRAFQESWIAQAREVLPGDTAKDFEAWMKAKNNPQGPDPAAFLKQFLDLEAGWLALNNRFELSETQLKDLRLALKAAVKGRDEQLPAFRKLMMGEGSFEAIQSALGKVDAALGAEMARLLPLRYRRYMDDWKRSQGSPIRPRVLEARPLPPRGRSVFIVTDPKTGATEVFDHVHVTERSAGYKVRFNKGQSFQGMTSANIIFEYNDRFVMAEPLAFELYRRVGNPACLTDFVRLTLNGHPMGYHLIFEQVNGSFLRRNHRNPDGDLFKILWYGRGMEDQHEKQDHPDRDHSELTKLVAKLGETKGDAQWSVIEKNFNVDEVVNYFAVNTVLSHWDGFFNNYFTYHDRKGTGKWEMYPWDQDKTWGFHDQSADKVFFDMPITFGMAGDRPPGGGPPVLDPRHWWRPGGFFSQPLLANPVFRQRFLKRTREILETQYTEKEFFPVIDAMAARLRPEVPIRAAVLGEKPEDAVARLDRNVASLKEHLVKRREFLLQQEEIVKVPR